MAGTVSFGGATSTGTFTDQWIQSNTIGLATGRIAANGLGPTIITAIRPFTSGRGAGRTISVTIGGASTGSFAIAAGGNGNVDQGFRSATNGFVSNGGTATYRINTNGSTWFSRDNVGTNTVDSYGTSFTGTLQGQYSYVEASNAATSPIATNNPGTGVLVSWTAPSDNGGTAITGYRIEYATNSGFTTGVGTVDVGAVTSHNFTTLTNGVTYWFRVYAKNAVTDAAGTTAVVSTSTSVSVGYWTFSGIGAFRAIVTTAGTYPNSVSFRIEHSVDVSDLPTGTYSASVVTFYVPNGGVVRTNPLKVNPSLVWQNSGGTTLSTVTGTSFETFSGLNTITFSNMTAPVGAATAKIWIDVPAANNYSAANLAVGDQFYADGAILTNGIIVPFFDGNTAGGTYVWEGTTNLSRSYDTSTATPIYDAYTDNNAVYQVRAGEVTVATIETNTFPISVQQPTVSDVYPALPGTYVVSASDNLIVEPDQWLDYGGSVRVEIGEEPGTFVLTLTGPFEEIPGVPGPYSLVVSDDENTYATFSILGNGVVTDPVTRRFSTGAAPERTTNEVALSYDSPFVSTLQEAVDAAAKLMIDAAGPIVSISLGIAPDKIGSFGTRSGSLTATKSSIYRYESLSVSRQTATLIGRPYVNADKLEAAWSGLTAGDFDAYWSDKTAGDFMIEPLRKP